MMRVIVFFVLVFLMDSYAIATRHCGGHNDPSTCAWGSCSRGVTVGDCTWDYKHKHCVRRWKGQCSCLDEIDDDGLGNCGIWKWENGKWKLKKDQAGSKFCYIEEDSCCEDAEIYSKYPNKTISKGACRREECTTQSGKTCIFPFYWGIDRFINCACYYKEGDCDRRYIWCATSVNKETGEYKDWDYCDPSTYHRNRSTSQNLCRDRSYICV